MDITAIEERLSYLEQEIAELRRENRSLRAAVPEATQDAKARELLPRRDLFKGAAYALGAVGLSLMGARFAGAATGTMIYGSASNNAGTSSTVLASSSLGPTLALGNLYSDPSAPGAGMALRASANTGHAIFATIGNSSSSGDGVHAEVSGTGHCVFAEKTTEIGNCVLAFQNSSTSFYAAILGVTKGAGPGCYGRGEGSGNGLWGQISDGAKTQSAVLGTTEGTGAGIEGNSVLGRGGVFKGKKAQVRLVPSSATSKPSTGNRGDLFVDSSGRLWYCKTGASTTGWVQLA